MNDSSFPSQPNPPKKSLAPQFNDKASVLAGAPLAVVGVMLWESYTGSKLETWQAVALGSVFASIIGYVGHVIKTLVDRAIGGHK